MAYLTQNQDPDEAAAANVATNIFQTNMAQPGQQAGAQSGMATPTSSNAGGDQSEAVSSGGQQQKAPTQSNSASSSKEVIRRNEGKAKSPYDLNEMGSNISKAKTDLQAEANSYVDNQKNAVTGYDNDYVSKALKGDSEAYSGVANRFNQARPDTPAFEQKTNTDYEAKTKELSDASLRNYFKNNAGVMGTAGDAAFDTMLLNKNKDFKLQRNEVQNQAAGLTNEAKAIKDKTLADGATAYQTKYDADSAGMKDYIKNQVDPIRTAAQQKADAENAKRQALVAAGQKGGGALVNAVGPAEYDKWLSTMARDLGQNSQEDNYLLNSGALGYDRNTNFIRLNPEMAQVGNYLDADSAGMLNRGQQLLGSGGANYSALAPLGSAYSYDQGAATAYLNSRLSELRGIQDKARLKEQDAAAARAQEEADKASSDAAARERQRQREAARGASQIDAATGGYKGQYDEARKRIGL